MLVVDVALLLSVDGRLHIVAEVGIRFELDQHRL